jgi:dihydropteroate synthase
MSSQDTIFKENFSLRYNGKTLDLSVPAVMGILNLGPDSFFDGGAYDTNEKLLLQAEKMLDEGAAILDLGAVSTRPGARLVEKEDELGRLLPALKLIRASFPEAFISVDTFRTEVARAAADAGADIINDVYAGNFDGNMFDLVGSLQIPYIIMHMQGTPETMQKAPDYANVNAEVKEFLFAKVKALSARNVTQVILDPGFGFGKTAKHNFQLLKGLAEFKEAGLPLLAGVSRKSMINQVIKTKPERALNGTTVVNTLALLNGASILRVHDVKEAMQAVKLIEFYKSV